MHVACPLCGSDADHAITMPIDAKTFASTAFGEVYRCRSCGFGFVHPRPTPAETEGFYQLEAYYTQGRSHVAEGEPATLQSRVRDHLAWRADHGDDLDAVIEAHVPAGGAVCDVGCGAGALAQRLVERGYRVTGIERDTQAISFQTPGFTTVQGAVEALPAAVPRGTFDAVVLSHVLEHIVDPVGALRGVAALLKPDGLLVCAVPNNGSTTAHRSLLAWEHLDVPRHVNFFDRRTLEAACCQAGLQVEWVFFDGYCRYFSNAMIATEQRIHDAILAADPEAARGSVRNSQGQAWLLLARTAFAPPERKYDSVGVVARPA